MSRPSWLLGLLASLAACKGDSGVLIYNLPPSVSILEPADQAVFEFGEPIVFRAKLADDSPVEDLELQWSTSTYDTNDGNNGILPSTATPDADGNLTFETANLIQGEHLITLRAFDEGGETGQASVTVLIEEVPEEPYITVVHPSNGEQSEQNMLFTIEVQVGDRQSDAATLTVQMTTYDQQGNPRPELSCFMLPGSNGTATCTPSPFPAGNYPMAFVVTDPDGNTGVASASLVVLPPEDLDKDEDGFTPNLGDCNDFNQYVYPHAPEECDGVDNDCDPTTPIDGPQTECWDDDGDGYCETGACANAAGTLPDCDDKNAGAYPSGATELPNDKDDNCNGVIDENTVNYDDDGDGYCESGDCVNTNNTQRDCNDAAVGAFPGNKETCDASNVDNDCDGEWNEKDAPGCTKYYKDQDGDGFGGKTSTSECWCAPGNAPFTGATNNDCLDTNANVRPGQTAYFTEDRGDNSFDYNCDGVQEKQYRGVTTGCQPEIISQICDVSNGAWQSKEPACGVAGSYLDECDTSIDAICLIFCTGMQCVDCFSCGPSPEARTQGCR